MKQRSLKYVLFFGLLATLIAAWFAPAKEKEDILLSDRSKNVVSIAQAKSDPPVSRVAVKTKTEPQVLTVRPRVRETLDDSRLFNSTYWTPPIKPTPLPVQLSAMPSKLPIPIPTPEVAPPIPFRVLGRYEDEGQTTLFVQFNEQSLAIRVGDTIGGKYKVENISATNVGLIYIPLNQPQSMPLGGPN
jgi:hypothetical protein